MKKCQQCGNEPKRDKDKRFLEAFNQCIDCATLKVLKKTKCDKCGK